MNPLVLAGAVALFFLLRKKKPTTPPPGQPGPGTQTPQGQLVILTNAVLANKLPCIDPAGKQRVFVLKEIEKQYNAIKEQLDTESQRAQPDEVYIAQISTDYNNLWNQLKAGSADHAAKCQKYFDDFSKRPGNAPGSGQAITSAQTTQQTRTSL